MTRLVNNLTHSERAKSATPRSGEAPQRVGSYLVISPCRDEEEHVAATIESMAAQTVRPARWVIVDDGSTDRTPQILAEAARAHSWIQVVRRDDRGERAVGPGVIEAFYAGLETVNLDEYEYICKLDADLVLPDGYFGRLIEEFDKDPRLGNMSGKIYLQDNDGRLILERMGDENAVGAAKFYRTDCFREIGGFARQVSWDGIDGHCCRMNGWVARSENWPELRIIHRRLMGSSHKSVWHGRLRWGRGKWYMGSAWYFVMAVALYRLIERPFIIGGIGILAGYFAAMLSRAPRYGDRAFRRYLRRFELESLLHGKRPTADKYHDAIRRDPIHKAMSTASVESEI